ncbi:hypothetical protein IPG41_02560 [Candidatus Peregrinibacteria bacterium]|nr:MAG: hypothetical protein IPG41_02560 [Candidatus Peregrinibacteria bacterium]
MSGINNLPEDDEAEVSQVSAPIRRGATFLGIADRDGLSLDNPEDLKQIVKTIVAEGLSPL